jgi:hypothetical protein
MENDDLHIRQHYFNWKEEAKIKGGKEEKHPNLG